MQKLVPSLLGVTFIAGCSFYDPSLFRNEPVGGIGGSSNQGDTDATIGGDGAGSTGAGGGPAEGGAAEGGASGGSAGRDASSNAGGAAGSAGANEAGPVVSDGSVLDALESGSPSDANGDAN